MQFMSVKYSLQPINCESQLCLYSFVDLACHKLIFVIQAYYNYLIYLYGNDKNMSNVYF